MGKDGKFTKKYAHGPKSVRNVMLYTQLKTTKSAAKMRMARIERNFGQKKIKSESDQVSGSTTNF